MTTADEQGILKLQELIISGLAQADVIAKLLIEKGLITQEEFIRKFSVERASYQGLLNKLREG